ncbi:MAG: dephospho-CoA kinase [Schaedlerella sp.]|nr:dephospho-CoA kinase [Schaedlerella sp.]
MKILGITGGVGSGKSAILNYLETEYRAVICQLDEVARMLQQKGQICFEKIVDAFGEEVIGEDQELDRAKLSSIVFSDAEKLQMLNDIVHPEVKCWVKEDIEKKKSEGVPLYVIEAALLPTAGYDTVCDEMWYIYTSVEVRTERLKTSRGYSEERIRNMIASQPAEEIFRNACCTVIENSGTFEETKRQIGELL